MQILSCVEYSFLCARGEKVGMIHRKLAETYDEGCINASSVCRWVQAFWEGKTELADEH